MADWDELMADDEGVDWDLLLGWWSWLGDGIEDCEPLTMTAFGDVFLMDEKGHVHFLDLVDGSWSHVADSHDAWEAVLDREESEVDDWFMPELVDLLLERDLRPGVGEAYGWIVPPVLDGEVGPDNLEVTGIEPLHFFMSQVHREVHDMPPGTEIVDAHYDPDSGRLTLETKPA